MIDRRQFLRSSRTAGAVAIGASCPALWSEIARSAEADSTATKLVVVELTGGNDGLNTVIPIDDELYRENRPTLAIAKQDAIELNASMAVHPSLKPLMSLWESRELAVVQNVGYPEPNRSHFRSMEIWQSGSVDGTPVEGWLGVLADQHDACQPMFVGKSEIPLAVRRSRGATPAINSSTDYQLNQGARLADSSLSERMPSNDLLSRISERNRTAAKIADHAAKLNLAEPVESEFESRLMTIQQMMKVDPNIRVFYTSRDGFDTHQAQRFTHANLLQDVARSLECFTAALKRDRLFEQVVVLVYSEFGRRVKENGVAGTDHGAAAPLFLIGRGVVGGLHGNDPDLTNLLDGDVKFDVDFRDVYATLLRKWFRIDPQPILGSRDEQLPCIA